MGRKAREMVTQGFTATLGAARGCIPTGLGVGRKNQKRTALSSC